MSIINSPLLNIDLINNILNNKSPKTTVERISLLSAKLHLLIKDLPSRPSIANSTYSGPGTARRNEWPESPVEILELRLELAKLHIDNNDLTMGEAEYSIIEKEISSLSKRVVKVRKNRSDNLEGGTDGKDGVGVEAPEWMGRVSDIRIEGLNGLIGVEEGLGRVGRAERGRELLASLQKEREEA